QKSDEEKDFAIRERNLYIAIAAGLLAALATILFLLRNNLRNRQRLHDERLKQMEQEQQVISLQSMLNGEETERVRIAKDLHDGLGGLFSTVKMHFSALQHKMPDLKKDELFQKSYNLADQASIEVRNIAHNMMPEVLMKLGLLNAVKDLSNNMSSGRLLKVSVEAYGLDARLDPSTEIILYRIIQELLNNIIRHADATEAIIQFTRDGHRLSVVVEDNGKGFDPAIADQKMHSGLRNIRSRVDYLNGKLNIDSQRNVGTTVLMDFEIHDAAHRHTPATRT
ncbi:MAG TPA: sensor histidine kinase, partial [Chryseosolibacter sp.]|nr:sensor histidine kinase [Chryseosolibacter sp.]